MADEGYAYRSAAEQAAALAAGEVSAVELAEEAIARIERLDPEINAVCVPDFDRALEAARAADAARAGGDQRPLLGVPMTVKESYDVAGLPTTWGFSDFKDHVPDADAVAVARVKAAGAVVLGKTNVPVGLGDLQSYNDLYGTTRNPWDPERIPGGSSGGSAAALAAGYGALSIGSDIGGSLRNPAHFCGIYAHKPTIGLVPARGHSAPAAPVVPAESDLAVVGPMARTAADLTSLLDVMAEPDELTTGIAYRLALPAARHDRLADYRVLVADTEGLIPTSNAVRTAIDEFAANLASSGAKVFRDSPLLPDLVTAGRVYSRLLMSTLGAFFPLEIYQAARAAAEQLPADDRSGAAERARGIGLSHRDWMAADIERNVLRERWRALFGEIDIVLCPVTPTAAFPHDHSDLATRQIDIDGTGHVYFDQVSLAGVATLPGLPATALPVGRSPEGLPIGVQAIGPRYEDRTTLRFAELAEREFGGFTRPPLD
ncbi:amidase [Pseudonocardia eucalypti]|uniref:Amidase n=1 Tax=Pseudonocardia eucalypti TaxID=648755 RepID=A0ABP9PZT6_9PSEU|nr:amidase [Pseudonocardia eucalypti]